MNSEVNRPVVSDTDPAAKEMSIGPGEAGVADGRPPSRPLAEQHIMIVIPPPPPSPPTPPGRPVLIAFIGAGAVVLAALVTGAFALAAALAPIVAHNLGH